MEIKVAVWVDDELPKYKIGYVVPDEADKETLLAIVEGLRLAAEDAAKLELGLL